VSDAHEHVILASNGWSKLTSKGIVADLRSSGLTDDNIRERLQQIPEDVSIVDVRGNDITDVGVSVIIDDIVSRDPLSNTALVSSPQIDFAAVINNMQAHDLDAREFPVIVSTKDDTLLATVTIANDVAAVKESITALSSGVVSAKETVAALSSRVTADITGIKETVATLSSGVAADIAGIKESVSALSSGVAADIAGIKETISGIAGVVAGLKGEVNKLKKDLPALVAEAVAAALSSL
jgi:hypothetical protein